MLIQSLLKRYFPRNIYLKIKSNYRKLKFKFHPVVSENEFRELLINKLDIKKGDVVFVHSSMDNLFLSFPYNKVVDILLETVGDDGTILFPTYQFHERAEDWIKKNEIFDAKRSPSAMGMISELARRNKKAVRSLHPTNSVVAIGKNAVELVSEHHLSIYPSSEKSPFHKMIHYNAKIVGLGVSTANLSFTHVIEDAMKDKFPVQTRKPEIYTARVKSIDGNILYLKTLVAHPNTGYRNVELFMKKHVAKNVCVDFKYKGINFFKANSKELFETMTNLAEKGVTIYDKKVYKNFK